MSNHLHDYALKPLQPEFKHETQRLLDDDALSDDELCGQARTHLQVFQHSPYDIHVEPAWVSRAEQVFQTPEREGCNGGYTTEKMLNAMLTAADELGLRAGRRYVSAAICACAVEAFKPSDLVGGSPPEVAAVADRLARALEELATFWVAYMLWPFTAISSGGTVGFCSDLVDSTDASTTSWRGRGVYGEIRRRYGPLEDQVARRERYTSFWSGRVSVVAPKTFLKTLPKYITSYHALVFILQPDAVMVRPDDPQEERDSKTITLDILKHFCELKDVQELVLHLCEPQNALFIDPSNDKFFERFAWCLFPTETPNRYEIRIQPEYDSDLPANNKTHVTFEDHSGSVDSPRWFKEHSQASGGVDLPNPELLRVHAALARVMYLSGAAGIFPMDACPDMTGGVAGYGGDFVERVVDGPDVVYLRRVVSELLAGNT